MFSVDLKKINSYSSETSFLKNNFEQMENEESIFKTNVEEYSVMSVPQDEESGEKKGFFASIISFFKNLFGFSDDDEKENSVETETEVTNNDVQTQQTQTLNDSPAYPMSTGLNPFDSNSVNGKIDETFEQGAVGDCVLLSSILSFSFSEQGSKMLSDAISVNKDASGNIVSYSVTFAGLGETYTITADELAENEYARRTTRPLSDEELLEMGYTQEQIDNMPEGSKVSHGFSNVSVGYSSGDNDVLLLEMAFEKCVNESKNPLVKQLKNKEEDALTSVPFPLISYLFMGKPSYTSSVENFRNDGLYMWDYSFKRQEIKDEKQYTVIRDYSIQDVDGKQITFKTGVVYQVESIEEGSFNPSVTIVDPDTNQKYTFKLDDLLNDNINGRNYMSEDDMLERINEGYSVIYGHHAENDEYITDVNGNKVSLCKTHEYAVMDYDGENVVLVNPHDASKTIVVALDELKKLDGSFSMYEF